MICPSGYLKSTRKYRRAAPYAPNTLTDMHIRNVLKHASVTVNLQMANIFMISFYNKKTNYSIYRITTCYINLTYKYYILHFTLRTYTQALYHGKMNIRTLQKRKIR